MYDLATATNVALPVVSLGNPQDHSVTAMGAKFHQEQLPANRSNIIRARGGITQSVVAPRRDLTAIRGSGRWQIAGAHRSDAAAYLVFDPQ